MAKRDHWAEWLLVRRHGGDEQRLKATLDFLYPVRDKVLDHAALTGSETLLDVGCGDGLIGFGALERLPQGRVIFSDISQDLLDHTRGLAEQMGALGRTAFLRTAAEELSPIADESVDAVTLRSVLIYVKDKRAAFRQFYRVLKPGGRLSLFEPINRFAYPEPEPMFWGMDATPIWPLARKVLAVFEAIQPPGEDPMLDFDERDLLALAEGAGFREVNLELEVGVKRSRPLHGDEIKTAANAWESLLKFAPNPRVPTLGEAIQQALTPEEIARFTAHLRPLVETRTGERRSALTYLWAVK